MSFPSFFVLGFLLLLLFSYFIYYYCGKSIANEEWPLTYNEKKRKEIRNEIMTDDFCHVDKELQLCGFEMDKWFYDGHKRKRERKSQNCKSFKNWNMYFAL